MSIRISNDQTSGLTSAQTNRAEQTPSSGNAGTRSADGRNTRGTDRIEVSSVAEAIGAGVSAIGAQQSAKVSQLRDLYASGKYEVDSVSVGRAMLTAALSGRAEP